MKLERSSSGYLTKDNIEKIKSHDGKVTDYLCSIITYFSLIPTIIYNLVWFFTFRNILENFEKLKFSHNQSEIRGCTAIYNWGNNLILWTIISFFKAIFLLLGSKLCCGDENDCNMLCIIIKSLTSFIPGIIFIYILPDVVHNYSFYTHNHISVSGEFSKMQSICDELATAIYKYYTWEYSYVILILLIFCFIPFAAGCMCVKEIWKSRGYSKKGE
jgi:hypothetical protein